MTERFIGWFCLDMPATPENLFSCRRVEPFATGETRRMAGSCNSFCQALSGIPRIFLKQGDVLVQDGCAMRYYTYDVSNGAVISYSKFGEKSVQLQKTGPLSEEKFPKQSKWDSSLTVMQEDCLGLCWLRFLSDRADQFENSLL